MSVDKVQQLYRQAGHHVPSKKRATAIVNALPFMATSCGMSTTEVLEVCVINHSNGATDRLVKAHKDYLKDSQLQ